MNEALMSLITAVVTAAVTWFLSRRKTNAEAKLAELDAAKTAATFYQNLLDDASRRLDTAISTIDKQDIKIKLLIEEIERLTDELKRYKQLK
ncbi:hypothetical protein Q765_00250 [Flavobacterium rivuli WB 3.3-2 = DSM 21788]|uniref:Uncharacterized protein n=1 Tax=Flavobacterium rivuli WB 3.3-2 = DSM 21788 TaxID=1121895 RepID=A0A0A2M9R7_9FLAO|nr:hypothetical protein [Flavobacterium rivuli]KGO88386.1 hypothetical protein Q765_00250 [Flavobacterium rivuli WB 3.3-2 = DSM 21788]